MMSNIPLKFNIYDQIGYLLVGSIALMLAYLDSSVLNIRFPDFNLTNLSLWIIVGYFIGHVVQAIVNAVIKENKDNFTENEQEIVKSARAFFKLENLSDNEIWNLCYMLVSVKDLTGQVRSFNAYYSLYRGWFVVFAAESLFILGYTIYAFSYIKLVLFFLTIVISILFYRRLSRFYQYLRNKVLQTFIVLRTLDRNI